LTEEQTRARSLQLRSLLRPHRGRIAALLFFSLAVSALTLVQPWFTKLLIDDGLLARDFDAVVRYALALFGATLLGTIAAGTNRWFYTRLSGDILFGLRERVYAHLQRLSPTFFTRNRSGDILARLDGDVAEVQRFALDSVFAALSGAFGLIGTIALMLALSPELTLVALAVLPLEWLWLRWMRPRVRDGAATVRSRASDISGFLVETLPAMKYVQSVAATGREGARLQSLNARYLDGLLHLQLIEFATALVPTALGGGARAIVFIGGGWQVVNGNLALGALIAFTSYLGMAMGPVQTLLGVYMGMSRVRVNLERVRHLTDSEPEVADTGSLPPPATGSAEIVLDNMSFAHDGGDAVLEDVSIRIPGGARVGVFGPSGAGKTTLVDLLLRHHDPSQGRILVDGRDLRDYDLTAWRRRVAFVSQDIVLFRGTVLENVRYAAPDADEAQVRDALERAQLGDFLERERGGVSTEIGERGARLSGGERQRLAIARAILQDPLLLIFDEATSSLDADTERELLRAIDSLFPNATRLIVSHREQPLSGVDKLLELRNGRIREVSP
jgi:ATP-binding cassette subfamily B protein